MGRIGMRTILILLLVLAPFGAQAQWNTTKPVVAVQTGARIVTASPGNSVSAFPGLLSSLLVGRTYVPASGQPGNGTFVDGLRTGPGPTASGVGFTARRSITWAATSKAVARALPLVGTALAIKELFDDIRCRESFAGSPECDDGEPKTTGELFRIQVGIQHLSATREGALAQAVAWLNANSTNGGQYTFMGAGCNPAAGAQGTCTILERNNFTSGSGFVLYGNVPTEIVSGQFCRLPGRDYPDGLCKTDEYTPADYPEIERKAEQHGNRTKAPLIWPALDQAGIPIEHPAPELQGPSAIQGGRETTARPDGTTQTRDTDHPMMYSPDGYRWEDRTTVREWPAGVTPDPVGTPPGGSTPPGTTTTGAPALAPIEVITCGLPGKPPCKIDESGTPTADAVDPVADAAAPLDFIATIGGFVFPEMSWNFALPSRCTPIPSSTFAEFFPGGFDICPMQPMFHDVMSVVWWLGGLFGAIGLFWRDQLAGT